MGLESRNETVDELVDDLMGRDEFTRKRPGHPD
jgi:hypothetical protein